MALYSRTEFKAFWQIDSADKDDIIDDCIDAAIASFTSKVGGRTFETDSDTTRYLNPYLHLSDDYTLEIPWDLCQITTIVTGNGDTIPATDYYIIPRGHVDGESPILALVLYQSSTYSWHNYGTDPEEGIAITGRWGYSIAAPDLAVKAVRALSKLEFDARKAIGGTIRTPLSGTKTPRPGDWPQVVKDAIDEFTPLADTMLDTDD